MAGFLSSHYVTRNKPCVICGKPDWCSYADFGTDGLLHYCQRVHQSSVIGKDGEQYYNKITKRYPDGMTAGGASIYESVRQREKNDAAYIEKLKRENPNYKGNRSFSVPVATEPVVEDVERVVVDEVVPLSNEKLDKVHRYLLSLLVLEENHEQYLRTEWNKGFNKKLADQLFGMYPIKSLPMNDQARFSGGYSLKNLSRKKIIEKMIERFSTLRGVPGFYQDQNGTWRMVNTSGIVYPEFDSDGFMYRIRIMDEHPRLDEYIKNAKGYHIYDYSDDNEIRGEYDYYYNREGKVVRTYPDGSEEVVYFLVKDKDGKVIEEKSIQLIDVDKLSIRIIGEYYFSKKTGEWIRRDAFTNEEKVVFSIPKGIKKVAITLQGYPKIDGKVDGKYKNFSSYSAGQKMDGKKMLIFNKYQSGCQSGSNISLYKKDGDNTRFVYITEGEKKAMVINQMLRCPAIALPGVNTYNKVFDKEYKKEYSMFQKLVESGATHFIICYDADKTQNQAVLNAESRAIELCKAHGVRTLVVSWDARYGKGADDILIAGKGFEVPKEQN